MSEIWSPQRDAELTRRWLHVPKSSSSAIAEAMHTTKNAIVGRRHRLKLPGRPSPINIGQGNVGPRIRRAGAVTLPPVAVVVPPAPPRAAPPAPPRPTPAPMPHTFRCLWPMWRNDERPGPNPRFCDAATVPPTEARPCPSYCAEHKARSLIRVRPAYMPPTVVATPGPVWDQRW